MFKGLEKRQNSIFTSGTETKEYTQVSVAALREFTIDVFCKLGVPIDDARVVTDVLITADQRGVNSHGIQRLKRYTGGLKTGVMKAVADIQVLKETTNTLLISGGDGLGQVVGYKTMELVIDKGLKNNIAFATVRDSNHFGMAAYYAMMALEYDLIGISLTNSAPLMVPTHGKNAIMGTNPISIAVPTNKECPFVLDMATSTATRGMLEVYEREGKTMPSTWATDEFGHPTQDIARVLANLRDKKGGGLLPLGSHKGYGLSLVVDILSGVLSGSVFGPNLYAKKDQPAKVSHFFGAIKIDAFIELERFKNAMDEYINLIRNSDKADTQDRIFIHGEIESEFHEKQKTEVSLYYKVVEDLRSIGEQVKVRPRF